MTEDAVKVCVRFRPLVEREENAAAGKGEPVQLFWKADSRSIYPIDDGNTGKSFSFDRVFTAEESTDQLYRDIAKPLVVSTVGGYNGTMFAYGQTCSGKTFTMMGSEHAPGVIPLAMEDVFQTIKKFPKKEFLLRVSYMEIYNETVTDLLVDHWKRKPLEVREGMNKNVYVADLTEELVTSSSQVLAWIRKGEKNRRYGKTKMNQRSSRSHTIFRMILESRERSDPASSESADGAIIVSNLNLVDLAGSERASQTGAEGERLKEGCNINRSLFTLGQVINKLTDETQKGYINYRDSKLTRILQSSLGGNAKTVIVCTVTPASLDETLSTLQFASTAKKMKNDPQVTEVSDDGALLKRYRNEIVDLKRRLQEVSSVEQTTATEKEVLSQLLQEKDQLQREQEDRIRNLTKLLVTGSNLVPVHKAPKRRVTWGGKMSRLSQASTCEDGTSKPFSRRRKMEHTLLSDMNEDEEFFDSQWGIPEDPPDDMEPSRTSMSSWSIGNSFREFASPGQTCELSEEVSSLKQQLEAESRQREEAMKTLEASNCRVAELEMQLQTEALEKMEALEKIQSAEQKVSELEMQLQTEAQQKMQTSEQNVSDLEMQLQTETLERMRMSEQKVSELEMQLQTEAQQKMEALERMQMSEQKVYELEMLLQTEAQQKMQTSEQNVSDLEMQLQQKMETVEMLQLRVAELEHQLEEQSSSDVHMRREFAEAIQLCDTLTSEKDMLAAERDSLKQELSIFMDQMEHLERDKAAMAEELKEMKDLEEFNALEEDFRKEQENEFRSQISSLEKALESAKLQHVELQNKLQTVSEELKKKSEYAEELQNMSGKNLVQEVAELRRSLDDAEGVSRDTKKEWAVLRSQNISLLELKATLTSSQEKMEAELSTLRLQLETEKSRNKKMQSDLQKELNVAFNENAKLTSLLDGKVPKDLIDSLELERRAVATTKELMAAHEAEQALKVQLEELQALPDKVDSLRKQVEGLSEELRGVEVERDGLKSACAQSQLEEEQLREALQSCEDELQRIQTEQQVDSLSSHQESWNAERSRLLASLEDMEKKAAETQILLESLQNQLRDERQRNADLQEEMLRMSQELQAGGARSSALEVDRLLSDVAALTTERDQLKEDMKENVDMMIETQAELRAALEKNREQMKKIKLLEVAQDAKVESSQLEELQTKMRSLCQEITSLQQERDRLLSEQTSSSAQEEEELLLHRVTALTEERDQLQEILEGVREEKKQMRAELEEHMETAAEAQGLLHSVQQQLQDQIQSFHDLQTTREEEQSRLEQQLSERTGLLQSLQEELQEQKQSKSDQGKEFEQRESDLKHQLLLLTEELEKVERNHLVLQEQDAGQRSSKEEEELLLRVTALTEERDQLQEILEGVREEKKQMRAELEEHMETAAEAQGLLHSVQQQLQDQIQSFHDLQTTREEEQSRLEQQLSERTGLLQSLQEELQEQKQSKSDQVKEFEQRESDLKHQLLLLTEELEKAERNHLVLQEEDAGQRSSKEEEELLLRVTALTEEKDQLQQELREEKQLKGELEGRVEMLLAEISGLNMSLQTGREQMKQLEEDLQHNMYLASSREALLKSVQEELKEQRNIHCDLEKLLQEKESSFSHKMQDLSGELESTKAERRSLLCESQKFTEEKEELLRRVMSLKEDKQQLGAQLNEEKEKIWDLQQKLSRQEQLEAQRNKEREQESRQYRELLIETNRNISALKEQLFVLEQKNREKEEEKQGVASSRLQESKLLLQESFGKLEEFINTCRGRFSVPLDPALRSRGSLIHPYISSLPEASVDVYMSMQQQGLESVQRLQSVQMQLQAQAVAYRRLLEVLVRKEDAVYEERRLQDLLLCRTQEPDCDLQALWERRLSELLDKRRLYQQKMENILEKLWAQMASHMSELRAEIAAREKFREQLQAAVAKQPIVLGELHGVLQCELERRSAAAQSSAASVQFMEEQKVLFDVLKQQDAQTESLLREEKSKTCTLLQALEGAPLKTELSLLKDNQELLLQLQEAQENVKTLHMQMEQLQEAQASAHSRLSCHKEATQLLQTELQDSRALVQEKESAIEEKESAIQTLRNKLRESEKRASPAAEDLENLKKKLFQMEVKLTSMSEEHKQEIQKMNSLLSIKEDSLRRLKEDLRRSQRRGEESFLEGEVLHAKLVNPKGQVVQSSILLEKTKLEEEVKQLHLKITQLESLVSSLQAEVTKWKNRAIKLKNKTEMDKPPSPCTTSTKRPPPTTVDILCSPKKMLLNSSKILGSPRKGPESPSKPLDSPKPSLFRSPKSRFFDACGASEMLTRSRPKQFFDNSGLGTTPDAAAGADRTDPCWTSSPKKEDFCKPQ
ncbi:Centromere-associated protein E [Oryzias melastigma]|uniref:Centromere-associated protein E n=1 Tax=Oryzias melastigma TaxID=30732 RepID=A0A834BXV9_ORYME|nr:Centromere-associated protein E [Oryzias melastigma]